MSHLPTERLAALADEPPTAAELAHLTSCAECARERAAYQSLVELAAGSGASIGAPLTTWEALRPKLLDDRIIGPGAVTLRPRRHAGRVWLQAAAAVLLVSGGMVAGRVTAGASPLPLTEQSPLTAAAPSTDSTPRFRSIDEARAAQTQSQLMYQTATAFLAQRDTANHAPESPAAIRTRLAALDRTRQVLDQALDEAPYDPVINGYYLTTLGQREATLRQLNTVAPASMRITSY
ncbi:MAG TPA: hypothetical protein VL383_03595 [Gemmatimonadaceae bacterium]|jgi:hypothetical protein|nr:hypothetical protein [Gemmatimonadaceae bacterium]